MQETQTTKLNYENCMKKIKFCFHHKEIEMEMRNTMIELENSI